MLHRIASTRWCAMRDLMYVRSLYTSFRIPRRFAVRSASQGLNLPILPLASACQIAQLQSRHQRDKSVCVTMHKRSGVHTVTPCGSWPSLCSSGQHVRSSSARSAQSSSPLHVRHPRRTLTLQQRTETRKRVLNTNVREPASKFSSPILGERDITRAPCWCCP